MDECQWLSLCCGAPEHYWVEIMCSKCYEETAFECAKCQEDTHRELPITGSLDCDPLSLNIMRAVGNMLKFYRGQN